MSEPTQQQMGAQPNYEKIGVTSIELFTVENALKNAQFEDQIGDQIVRQIDTKRGLSEPREETETPTLSDKGKRLTREISRMMNTQIGLEVARQDMFKRWKGFLHYAEEDQKKSFGDFAPTTVSGISYDMAQTIEKELASLNYGTELDRIGDRAPLTQVLGVVIADCMSADARTDINRFKSVTQLKDQLNELTGRTADSLLTEKDIVSGLGLKAKLAD